VEGVPPRATKSAEAGLPTAHAALRFAEAVTEAAQVAAPASPALERGARGSQPAALALVVPVRTARTDARSAADTSRCDAGP
jgi:hypothetical protein